MNIIYISFIPIDLCDKNIYVDLIKELLLDNKIYLIGDIKNDLKNDNLSIYKSNKTVFNHKNRFIKGIYSYLLQYEIKKKIKKSIIFKKIDLVLYATPPIMYNSILKYIKKNIDCITYLMLKDIFPQNAVDERIIQKNSILYNLFRKREKELYRLSDYIGCMSEGNIKYLVDNNKEIDRNKVELFYNSEKIVENEKESKSYLADKFGINIEKTIFVFGGNLGIAQGIKDLIYAMNKCINESAFFIIIGDGVFKDFIRKNIQENSMYIERMNRNEYQKVLSCCDVGIISLDKKYTIPNYPSRILSYMQSKLAILAYIDDTSDIGDLIENKANCGRKVLSGDFEKFKETVHYFCKECDLKLYGTRGFEYCKNNFDVSLNVKILKNKVN